EDAANLQTTYGFPIDLTAQMALELGLGVDLDGYHAAMERHRVVSGQGREQKVVTAVQGALPSTDDSLKYKGLAAKAKIVAWVKDNLVGLSGKLGPGDEVALVLDT